MWGDFRWWFCVCLLVLTICSLVRCEMFLSSAFLHVIEGFSCQLNSHSRELQENVYFECEFIDS